MEAANGITVVANNYERNTNVFRFENLMFQ